MGSERSANWVWPKASANVVSVVWFLVEIKEPFGDSIMFELRPIMDRAEATRRDAAESMQCAQSGAFFILAETLWLGSPFKLLLKGHRHHGLSCRFTRKWKKPYSNNNVVPPPEKEKRNPTEGIFRSHVSNIYQHGVALFMRQTAVTGRVLLPEIDRAVYANVIYKTVLCRRRRRPPSKLCLVFQSLHSSLGKQSLSSAAWRNGGTARGESFHRTEGEFGINGGLTAAEPVVSKDTT